MHVDGLSAYHQTPVGRRLSETGFEELEPGFLQADFRPASNSSVNISALPVNLT
jgi:hypothetical protein